MILTSNQITKRVKRLIRQKFSATQEQIINRKAHGLTMGKRPLKAGEDVEMDKFQTHAEAMADLGEQMAIDSDLERRTLVYNKAVSRLNKPLAEEGRAEQIIAPVYKEGYEDVLKADRPIAEEGYTIKAIEPVLPLMVEKVIYDDEGHAVSIEEVVNPIIQKDRDERAKATEIVNKGIPV